jgi:hypothetical protein
MARRAQTRTDDDRARAAEKVRKFSINPLNRAFSTASISRILARLLGSNGSSASRPSTSTRIEASGLRSSCDAAATRSVFKRVNFSDGAACRRAAMPMITITPMPARATET